MVNAGQEYHAMDNNHIKKLIYDHGMQLAIPTIVKRVARLAKTYATKSNILMLPGARQNWVKQRIAQDILNKR